MDAHFDTCFLLDGWALYWAELEATGGDDDKLAILRREVAGRAQARFKPEQLSTHPPVKAIRLLFRAAGTDPTKYRPSSEALLRRLVRGEAMPAISPLVDISNCLSAELAIPVCVMAQGSFRPPFEFRAGVEGENYESLRGPFRLHGKPLLCDTDGPLDTPITGNARVKVTSDTRHATLVAYLPAESVRPSQAHDALERLIDTAPVARILCSSIC